MFIFITKMKERIVISRAIYAKCYNMWLAVYNNTSVAETIIISQGKISMDELNVSIASLSHVFSFHDLQTLLQ